MIAVVDSGVANLTSVMAAFERIGVKAEVTSDAAKIRAAKRVILPGVGAPAPAMAQFNKKYLTDVIRGLKQPVLGICLGMQLLFERSYEGNTPVECLGILPGDLRAIKPTADAPVPHMGWNQINPNSKNHPLLRGINPGDYVYFVHSYAAPVSDTTIAVTDYNGGFAAMAAKDNFYGCQFHPERSGTVGSRILENFASI